jgi:hypothetical protein
MPPVSAVAVDWKTHWRSKQHGRFQIDYPVRRKSASRKPFDGSQRDVGQLSGEETSYSVFRSSWEFPSTERLLNNASSLPTLTYPWCESPAWIAWNALRRRPQRTCETTESEPWPTRQCKRQCYRRSHCLFGCRRLGPLTRSLLPPFVSILSLTRLDRE